MQKKYQICLIVITLMLVCSILIASSYAYWSVTEVQEDTNILTSGCFDATLEGKNAINLDNAYPMTNDEGRDTTLYSFTIKNTCSIDSSYVVNLEVLKGSTLGGNYIKILFNNATPVLYSSLESVETVVADSVDSKKLISGRLIAGGSITYTLQLWMDESATTDQAGQIFNSKIVVTTEATNMAETLARKVLDSNPLVEIAPTLTTSSNNTTDPAGLYKSNLTNDGGYTYYFRGNVINNYVSFAGFTWRIVRINEDGTVRLILQDGINSNTAYDFNSTRTIKEHMYYSNSDVIKPTLDAWFDSNIVHNSTGNLSSNIVSGNYFCEEARTLASDSYLASSGADMILYSSYEPNFTCEVNGKDGNGKGFVSGNIGLISYDEVVFAGGYYNTVNKAYYLNDSLAYWTMSPAGSTASGAYNWYVNGSGYVDSRLFSPLVVRPVINLKSDVTATGLGTEESPYVIK